MKKFLLFLVCFGSASAAFSQTLFTFGETPVDKSEFTRAYNKNRVHVDNKEKAYREYLELYIKFKLKVRAAYDLGLDTMPQLQYDLQSFRTQIENSYLNNEQAANNLLNEAFLRSQKDLHILHFFIPVTATTPVADTQQAIKSINGIHAKLVAGKTDYEDIVASQPVKASVSDFGFVTTFTLPYEYENIVYALKNGQSSKPYRSKKGWHVFKLTDERKAMGKWRIAQILFSVPPGASDVEKKLIERKADSVYQLLLKGEEFGKMARWFSDDKVTYGNNGELPEFGSGKFTPDFENEVFKLTKDNDISKPFLSAYGYHIVKRLSQIPVPTDRNDPALEYELKRNIQNDSRINMAKELFAAEVLKQVKYKKLKNVSDADLFRFADSIIAKTAATSAGFSISGKPIVSIEKTMLTAKDWLDFVLTYKGSGELYQNESNAELLNKFISGSVMEYYKKHLQDYNADFRYQMEEFKAGNVLFEIMEKNIWNKASGDAAGLEKMYASNKSKYTWAASADIILVSGSNKTVTDQAKAALENGKEWRLIMEESNGNIQVDSGRFEISQIPEFINAGMQPGAVSKTVVDPKNSGASFVKLITRYEANMPRSFDDAKGMVINDYQNAIEEKWIADLKKKYPVKVNEAVFQSLFK